ncbi:MAG: LLM class flavin-dependent oxidoreductase [Thermoflexales bacterium]|nr:LLM class flavin-dependent oxidoreductase [Thermoflexales bacterium]
MKYGFVFPRGDARLAADFAAEAERAGWDGFFVWEPVWGVDAWVSLAAAAMTTATLRLGTLLTPPSRRRPWKLASETATLDRLSGGRLILSVGLGAVDTGFAAFGEALPRRTRAELLDESLDILTGLWRGQPFEYTGRHYRITPTAFYPPPPPVQQPRIPIWVAAELGAPRSMARALRFDGVLPNKHGPERSILPILPSDIAALSAQLQRERAPDAGPFDIVVEGVVEGNAPGLIAERVRPMAEAGATWWIEAMWSAIDAMDTPQGRADVLARLRMGPPRC